MLRECIVIICKELLEIFVEVKRLDVLDDIVKFINNGIGVLGVKFFIEESFYDDDLGICR